MAKNPYLTLGALILLLSGAVGIWRVSAKSDGLGRAPEVVSFTAKAVASQPGAAVLTWKAHAVNVVIEATPEGAGREATELTAGLGPNGSLTVHPTVTTKYVMRCIGPFSGYAGLPVEVTVQEPKTPGSNLSL